MAMEDLMKALMQSAAQSQGQTGSQGSAGADALSQVIGGLMGGQGGGSQGAAAAGMLSQVVGGLMGGSQQGGAGGDQLLGALEGIIGGQPGTGQPLSPNQGAAMNMSASDPIMMMLQPVVNQLAAKANISPQIATVVVSIALHYLLSSHPSTSPKAPLDLGSVMQQLASGKINPTVLQNSGMVNDVMQATGLNKQQATQSLNTTFGALGGHIQAGTNMRRSL